MSGSSVLTTSGSGVLTATGPVCGALTPNPNQSSLRSSGAGGLGSLGPLFETVSVHVHSPPWGARPLTLFVLVTARSGAATVTLSPVQMTGPGVASTIVLYGSTWHTPPVRGFVKVPVAAGVAAIWTSK